MSAPSAVHEARVRVLETIATLAGFTHDVVIGTDLYPDVARYDISASRLFIGDGKATETSGCAATHARLERYVRAISAWQRVRSAPLIIVIAHGWIHDAAAWVDTVVDVGCCEGHEGPYRAGSMILDDDCALAYAAFVGARERKTIRLTCQAGNLLHD